MFGLDVEKVCHYTAEERENLRVYYKLPKLPDDELDKRIADMAITEFRKSEFVSRENLADSFGLPRSLVGQKGTY